MTAKPRSTQPHEADVPEPVELTGEEAWAFFDEEARRWLGMSGEEFLRAWDARELDVDGPDHTRIIRVSMLIPFVRA